MISSSTDQNGALYNNVTRKNIITCNQRTRPKYLNPGMPATVRDNLKRFITSFLLEKSTSTPCPSPHVSARYTRTT